MTYPDYFKFYPRLDYLASVDAAGNGEFKETVDIFRNNNLPEKIFKYKTFYYNYNIQDGETPETVAEKVYEDSGLYWLILQINNIVDPYTQWPLSNVSLEEYIVRKYGSWAAAGQISHYETVEVKNDSGQVILPAGIVVSADYVFRYFPDPNNKETTPNGDYVKLSSFPVPVTFEEVEQRINNKKKTINLLNRRYVSDYVRLFRKELEDSPRRKSEVDLSKFVK